ncbi:tail assembly chaperone [Holdemanella biformis]|uniref:Tail assembly chaperone n=1 Tax=Siphoviridae sp. ctaA31 TaxID=2827894 RepID=A0A8S5T4G3_9CAUD|nr:MAG TPA: tail assembly chaperone [Siphoviridae sp. ctaA31]
MSKYMEIEVNGEIYKLVAGFGFLHEVNKKLAVDVKSAGTKKEIGLKYMVASIIDGDIDALVDCIFYMNSGQTPRLKKQQIESYLEDVEDIDKVFEDVINFLSHANVCRKEVMQLMSVQEAETK